MKSQLIFTANLRTQIHIYIINPVIQKIPKELYRMALVYVTNVYAQTIIFTTEKETTFGCLTENLMTRETTQRTTQTYIMYRETIGCLPVNNRL